MKVSLVSQNNMISKNLLENLKLEAEGSFFTRKALKGVEYGEGFSAGSDYAVLVNASTELEEYISISPDTIYICIDDDEKKAVSHLETLNVVDRKGYVFLISEVFGKWDDCGEARLISGACKIAAETGTLPVIEGCNVRNLVYIDSIVEGVLDILDGKTPKCRNGLCSFTEWKDVKTDYIRELLERFIRQQNEQFQPEIVPESFESSLFAAFLSYIPTDKLKVTPAVRKTNDGCQYFLMTGNSFGQFKINKCPPRSGLAAHWHNTKWEQYIVIGGKGLIKIRKLGETELQEIEVSGNDISIVQMLPGYIHCIENTSDSEDLSILIWASEPFNPKRPDTNYADININ